MSNSSNHKPVILLSFANDAIRPLRELANELDELKAIFRQAERDGKCEVVSIAAATPQKLIQAFQEYRGCIRVFHYAGHSSEDEVFLASSYEKESAVKAKNLVEFLALQENLELFFLNSCLSLNQAKLYHEAGVKSVIATDSEIGDQAAKEFAILFYRGLSTGADLQTAFLEAKKGLLLYSEEYHWRAGRKLENTATKFPWQTWPKSPHKWKLPLVAKHLTRIPIIDLKNDFIGRYVDMKRLKEKVESSPKVVLVNGLGGIGKTVLATAYVQKYGDNYDHLAWINRGEDLIKSIALNDYLADTLGLPFEQEEDLNARFRRILRKLHQLPGQNLLVIDNAQEQVAQKDIYDHLPGAPNWKVLLTSRLNLSGFDRLPLNTLDPVAARKLFQTHYKGEYTEEELNTLLQEIGYHTLTVELLAKLLDKLNNVLRVSELTEVLKQKQLDNPDLQEKIRTNHSVAEHGIYLHLMKAFELSGLTDQEKWLLKQFVVLPIEQYKVSTLADFLGEKPLKLNKQLNSLEGKGWLTLNEDKTFSIHRLIRQVTEYQLKPDFANLELLVKSMIQKFSADPHTNRLVVSVPWLSFAKTVADYLSSEKHEQLALLNRHIAATYRDLGNYDEMLLHNKKVLAIYKAIVDPEHREIAISYNNIGISYRLLGKYKNAMDYHQKALKIRKSILSPLHPDLAQSYNNIAATLSSLSQDKQALINYQNALKIYESILGTDHPKIGMLYNNIGVSYQSLGQTSDALGYHQKALAIQESVLDSLHPELGKSYNNIGTTYDALGQYEKALSFWGKACAIWESVLEPDHPHLALLYKNIALTNFYIGKYKKTLDCLKKGLKICESVSNANKLTLASYYNSIGFIYLALKKSKKALEYHQKALAIYQSAHDSHHPDLALFYNNIALTFHALGQNRKALNYYQKAIEVSESELNNNGPFLAWFYHNIGLVYRDLNKIDLAESFHQKALAIYQSAHDSHHPSLALSYNNMAVTYFALGKKEKGEEYEAKATSVREKRNKQSRQNE